ncbi:MAG TPA: hypothetical protein VIG57_20060 [Candidatus Entotheonella sp.]|jgi:hypothetical protein
MDIQIVPVRHEPVEGDRAGLDLVACEWRYIGIVEGHTTRVRKLDGFYDDMIGMVLILKE